VFIASIAAFVGMVVVIIWLPARAVDTEVFAAQDAEEARAEAEAAREELLSAPAPTS
jgi:hypothetical protein